MRLTIEQYSKKFQISKDEIISKLRSKELHYVIEDEKTYIIEKKALVEKNTNAPTKQKTTVAMVIALYQKENQQLKEKITKLENKIDKLIDDKEKMLRAEMEKIEKVYQSKDEQLKNVLELINQQIIEKNNHFEKKTTSSDYDKIIELKEYLKSLDIEHTHKKIIKKRFLNAYGSDIRVIKQNGKLYLDLTRYDYSDLLE